MDKGSIDDNRVQCFIIILTGLVAVTRRKPIFEIKIREAKGRSSGFPGSFAWFVRLYAYDPAGVSRKDAIGECGITSFLNGHESLDAYNNSVALGISCQLL